MVVGKEKIFCTHLGDLAPRSPSFRSGTEFNLSNNKVRNAHLIATKLGRDITLVMLSTWSNFWGILFKTFANNLFCKISNPFSPFEHSICHILGMVVPIDVKQKGKWVNSMWRWLWYLWPWPLILNFQGQILSRKWEARLSWNESDESR